MKKLLLVIAAVAMLLPSCKKINEALDSLDGRLDKLEQEAIPSIDEQIAAINVSLDNLNAMDKELKGYIDNLTATAANLQEQINNTNTKIEEVKSALQGEISTAKANVIAKLEAAKEELENELAIINATIATLQAKDAELDGKIANLQTYVDTELGKTTDWASATFATLEQYNALASEVATIKEQIRAINQSITELETRLTTKINEDIANAVSTLNADIQQKVNEITDAYTNAVKTAKEEITTAYTTAIQNAINALDVSLKAWVGEQLANYYTIAEVEAKITALQTAITNGDATLQEELKSLKSQLETTAAEITAAYKKAIEEAINTNNGVIDTKIANEIASVNQRINNEVAALNAKIAEIESRLDNVEAKIAELLARIQSVSYIPTYDDGKATVVSNGTTSQVTLDFEVSPKDAVVELAKVWQSAVSVKAIYTQTRAVSFIDMPIVKFESDPVNGVISVTASAENLSAEFFASTQSASARLSISDGNNALTSEYIQLYAGPNPQTNIVFEDLQVKAICCNNWDTNGDGELSYAEAASVKTIDVVFKFNKEIIAFTELKHFVGLTEIPIDAFNECKSLIKISLPKNIKAVGDKAFYQCENLSNISVNVGITSIGNSAFCNCAKLSRFTIPDSVISIGENAFCGCVNLSNVSIGKEVSSIGSQAFASCSKLTSIVIPDGVTSIENQTFSYCKSLSSITIPNSVTSIGSYAFMECHSLSNVEISNSVILIERGAFYYCSSLTEVVIGSSVSSIEDDAFGYCPSLTTIYCKPTTPPAIYYNTNVWSGAFESNSGMKIYVPRSSYGLYTQYASYSSGYTSQRNWYAYESYIKAYDF